MTRFLLGLLASSAFALNAAAQAPVEPLKPLPAIPAAPCTDVLTQPSACCPRHYVSAEWLYWTVQGNPLPVLITAAPVTTDSRVAGQLDQSTTTIVAGGRRSNSDFRNGLLVTAGWWLDDAQKTGIEASYFFLEDSRQGVNAISSDTQIIAIPFNTNGVPTAATIGSPGGFVAGVFLTSTNEFEGGAVTVRRNLRNDGRNWVDATAGYRYLNSADSVSLTTLAPLPGTQAFFTTISSSFNTRNIFHGGTVGLAGGHKTGKLTLEGRASVGLGNMHRTANISGYTIIASQPPVFPESYLARSTNIGTYESDEFAVVPEASVKASWQATEQLRFNVGFNWLLMDNVLRAGDQIDVNVSNTQPVFPNRETTQYVYGASFGAEFRW